MKAAGYPGCTLPILDKGQRRGMVKEPETLALLPVKGKRRTIELSENEKGLE